MSMLVIAHMGMTHLGQHVARSLGAVWCCVRQGSVARLLVSSNMEYIGGGRSRSCVSLGREVLVTEGVSFELREPATQSVVSGGRVLPSSLSSQPLSFTHRIEFASGVCVAMDSFYRPVPLDRHCRDSCLFDVDVETRLTTGEFLSGQPRPLKPTPTTSLVGNAW